MPKIEEMNLPIINVAPVGVEATPSPEYAEVEDVPQGDCSKINVWVDTVKPVDVDPNAQDACFDVVFTVGVVCDAEPRDAMDASVGGSTKTYTVVKRIKVNKLSLAKQAESGQPVSVIENTKAKEPIDHLASIHRMRVLAGLE